MSRCIFHCVFNFVWFDDAQKLVKYCLPKPFPKLPPQFICKNKSAFQPSSNTCKVQFCFKTRISVFNAGHGCMVIMILFRYAPHYGIIMHTSLVSNRSAVTLQSHSNANHCMVYNPRRGHKQTVLPGVKKIGVGPKTWEGNRK